MTKFLTIVGVILLVTVSIIMRGAQKSPLSISTRSNERVWSVKSIDTMKYSRDLAREKLKDPSFDKTIDGQVRAISETGANYIAIATPYDEQFIPYLTRWVLAARKYNLSVWFRGNFSGWEGWFGYEKITPQDHKKLLTDFISKHSDLFEDGDIFSPCPECENGGPGDPRYTTSVDSFRQFMIEESRTSDEEFKKVGKKVSTNFAPMNFDVAKLVMDRETARQIGNLIVIDHYVSTPEKLASDITSLASSSSARIFLGEFGAPIPDIHGRLTEQEQADWIDQALLLIKDKKEVIGLNYWVGVGGSTAIFNSDNTPKPAAKVLEKYFKLPSLDNS